MKVTVNVWALVAVVGLLLATTALAVAVHTNPGEFRHVSMMRSCAL